MTNEKNRSVFEQMVTRFPGVKKNICSATASRITLRKAVFVLLLLVTPLLSSDDFFQTARQILGIDAGQPNHKCGFPVMLQVVSSDNPELQQLLHTWRSTQQTLDQVYTSEHFEIHYTTLGFNAIPIYDRNQNGTPDYLEFVASAFERAWRVEIDTLGFNPPPDSTGAPKTVYTIYCRRMSDYGVTEFSLENEIAALPGYNFPSSIAINTDFSFVNYPAAKDSIARDSMAIAVTAAHAFNHALQLGYNLWFPDNTISWPPLDVWFIESSAVFMEEVVAPAVNDYLFYLNDYFRSTDKPLDDDGSFRIYGEVVLEILLGERHGRDITRKVWEEIRNQRALPALNKVLNDMGSDIYRELTSLAEWLYFSGSRALAGQYFPDAPLFPELPFRDGLPVQSAPGDLVQDSLPRLSFQWYQSPVATSGSPSFFLKPEGNALAQYLQSLFVNEQTATAYLVPSTVNFSFPDPSLPPNLFFCVINGVNSGEEFFPFRVLSLTSIRLADVYPQPLRLSDNHPILTFANLKGESDIHIFSSNGRHLRRLQNGSGANFVNWDLRTEYGRKVGSGVYLYRIKSEGMEKTGKFVIVR